MKKLLICLAAVTFFSSCENDNETSGLSAITNYPVITVTGDEVMFVPVGGTFNDPGAVALEGENEIPTVVTAEGQYRGENTLNTNVADIYNISYTATNQDGFNGTETRQVVVYETSDLVTGLEGLYTSTVFRNGVQPTGNPEDYTDIEYILIWQNEDGSYEFSDAFGGWYVYGRGLGVGYASQGGTFTANNIAANDFTFGPSFTNSGFGGEANITGINVDPANNQITVDVVWVASPETTYNFQYVLTQVQPQP